MSDLDAVSALLMLSEGYQANSETTLRTITPLNNNSKNTGTPNGTSPPKRRYRKNVSPKQLHVPKSALRVTSVYSDIDRHFDSALLALKRPAISIEPVDEKPLAKKATTRKRAAAPPPPRMSSSSPDLERWERGNTLSPTIVQHPERTSEERTPHPMYGSPGMNGFAMMLKSGGNKYTSSPEPPRLETAESGNGPVEECGATGGSSIAVLVDKPARSPSDSGVSSILDEMLQPNLVLKRWRSDAGVPECVQQELDKIIEISSYNKDLYTKAKLAKFPLEMGFNPNKSRMRKNCENEVDNQDRLKNNESSRRSRHKKKLMTHMLNTSLEFDRQENRQLYIQERWLTNVIGELEEKALNRGIDPQYVRKLRQMCGFQ